MKTHWVLILAIAALPAACLLAESQTLVVQFDPKQTSVEFTLGDVLHTVHGSFQLRSGRIEFDPDSGKADGQLIVDATSGNSGSEARDSRMHKNILESNRYPDIIFRPDRIVGNVAAEGASHTGVHGLFTIHGSAHEITLPVDIKASGGRMEIDTRFPVPYVQWGMKNPSNLLLRVNQTVDIHIHGITQTSGSHAR